ncbi:MAG TPA: TonB-dependent receptor [Hyphomonadaceae bacterium]|nr:TonB-dependent receptor [Hyphomonadaceae bacterium]
MFRLSICAAVSAPALALAAVAGPALAQQSPGDPLADAATGPNPGAAPEAEEQRRDVVIVVGQSDAPTTVVPRGLAVSLGEEQFDAINAVNVEDLMKYAPNFFIRKRYIGDPNGVPGFRGTHSSQSARTLAMVDGFVISNFLGNSFGFPPKWGVVGPGEVKQYDIVYGPYSARYSGNSMGGLISITTKAPENNEAFATAQYFVQPYEQYGTDDVYQGYTFEAGAGWRPADGPFAVRASWRHFENTGQPMSWYQFTASNAPTGTPVTGAVVDPELIVQTPIFAAESPDENTQDQLRLRADLDVGEWKLQGLGVYWTTESDRTHPQIYIRDTAGNPVTSGVVEFGGQRWTPAVVPLATTDRVEFLTGVKAQGPVLGWDASINLSRFWQDKDEAKQSNSYALGLADGAGRLTRMGEPNWTTLDAVLERGFGNHALAVGLTVNQYETETQIYNTSNWREASDPVQTNLTGGKTRITGAFVEDEIAFADDYSMTFGARVDRWEAFDGVVGRSTTGGFVTQEFPERDETDVNGAISAQWELSQDMSAQLSLATATRFPTVGELFQGVLLSDGSFDPNSFDPDLKPERSKDANLVLRRDFGTIRLTGSLFYQLVEDALFRQQGFNQFGLILNTNQNIDEVRQIGVEGIFESSDWLLDGLDMELNVAFIDSEILSNPALPASEGKQFPRIPYWRANGSIRYAITDRLKANVGFRINTETSNNLEHTQIGDTFGYASEQFVIDTRLSWMATDHAEVSFGIDNINNDKSWAFHPFPQRTFVIEARWRQ